MGIFSKIIFFCLFLTSCTSLIYQPDKYMYAHPDQFKIKFEAFTILSRDGTKLSAWRLFSKNLNPKNILVYFHGNAQNLTSHFVNAGWLTENGYDVIIFDYRGYGVSEGEPNPKGVSEDGLAFLDYTYQEYKKGNFKKLIVYAQSLGGAVALKSLEDFSHRDEISLLVLDSTFLSPREVAREKTNRVLAMLFSNDYTADPKLAHLTMPVLSIHSTEDYVIAYKLGQDLHQKIPATTKKDLWTFNARGHGDVFFVENQKYRHLFLDYVNHLY
ncbi:MAG: alpha/beta fold hydrolase [Bacteriovorax sp.]|nr:alpha/beta fold hydrolase [Bacteriovorax sp.]